MNKKLKRDISDAFNAPSPERKSEFLYNLHYPKSTPVQFFLSQILFIRKRFWALSIAIVMFIIFTANVSQLADTVCVISPLVPLLTILGVSEMRKSFSYNMCELEESCRYNLSKIILIRLSFIATFHFIAILIIILLLSGQSHYGVMRYLLYSLTPFMLSSYLSLLATKFAKSNDTTYICGAVSVIVCVLMIFLNDHNEILYSENILILWLITFAVLLILVLKEIYMLVKERTKQWNFV